MAASDLRKTKRQLVAELEALRLRAQGLSEPGRDVESEERYRRLIEFLPDAVRVACEGIIVYVNAAAVELFGADGPEQLIGREAADFVLPADREMIEARHRMLYAWKRVPMQELRRLRLDGSVVHVEAASIGITWQGKPAVIAVMRDISKRIAARAALEESERRLAAVAENIPGVAFQCVLHPNGRISYPYVSPGVRRLFGVEPDAIMRNGLRLLKTIHPDDRKAVRESLRNSGRRLKPFERQMRVVIPNGETSWVRCIARPRRRGDGVVVWEGLFLDETRRRAAEEALRRAKDAAELANRTKRDFLAHMSHELRTPLNVIMGFSEVIEKELFGPVGVAQYLEYAGDIRESGRHLLELINDILDISKLEAGMLDLNEQDVDIARVIESCVRLLKLRAANGKLKLAVRIAKTLPHLRGDERRIRQILLNLLSNASKFTPDGGTVRVTVDADADRGMRIRVADTGIGIPKEDIAMALAPFGQVRDAARGHLEGTGLGLPLTKSLVERHGGRLDLKSRPGEGTTITVRFPSVRLVA